MSDREKFEAALGLAGYYESTWVGDKSDLQRFHTLAIAEEQKRMEPIILKMLEEAAAKGAALEREKAGAQAAGPEDRKVYESIAANYAGAQALREAAERVARIAHCGGLVGMSEFGALNAIRKETLPYWDRSETLEQMVAALRQQVGINGMTEAETATSASVIGLVGKQGGNV